jgi:hypothetical protein
MPEFTFDAESVTLRESEYVAFVRIVEGACYLEEQFKVSRFLATVRRPQDTSVLDFLDRQVAKMWRAEARLGLRNLPGEVVAMDGYAAFCLGGDPGI